MAEAPEAATSAANWFAEALDSGLHFRREFLTAKSWIVVPVESGLHFDAGDAACLAETAAACGSASLTAVVLEDVDTRGTTVPATREGVLSLNAVYGHFNIGLVPDDRGWAVVCTIDDYYLVAGPVELVNKAVHGGVDQARVDFARYAEDGAWDAADRSRLLAVLEACDGR
jgi:hypothetical protein